MSKVTRVRVDDSSASIHLWFCAAQEGFSLRLMGDGWAWFSDEGDLIRLVVSPSC